MRFFYPFSARDDDCMQGNIALNAFKKEELLEGDEETLAGEMHQLVEQTRDLSFLRRSGLVVGLAGNEVVGVCLVIERSVETYIEGNWVPISFEIPPSQLIGNCL